MTTEAEAAAHHRQFCFMLFVPSWSGKGKKIFINSQKISDADATSYLLHSYLFMSKPLEQTTLDFLHIFPLQMDHVTIICIKIENDGKDM